MTKEKPETKLVSLANVKMLVVEDETIVSFLIEDMLAELGCSTVWQCGRVADALALLGDRRPDAALLDVNLSGEYGYPVAVRLAEAKIPFVFTTGYGSAGIQSEWASRPVLQKPFNLESLADALQKALAQPS